MRIPVPSTDHYYGHCGPLSPTPIIPDRFLPPALQRQLVDRKSVTSPNDYDQAILQEAWAWKTISEHGGIKSCCRIPELGAPVYDNPPWLTMPSGGIPYKFMFSLLTTAFAPFAGVDIPLQDPNGNTFFQVPFGWDGVIQRVIFGFTGAGLDEFSGNIVWRIRVGMRYGKNIGNVVNQLGSFTNSASESSNSSIRLVSGQSVTMLGNIPALSPVAGGRVTAGVFGWFYPRR